MRWNAHEDFQSYSPVLVSARNCLMWNTRPRRPRALECAGVIRNALELGTTWAQVKTATESARPPAAAATAGSSLIRVGQQAFEAMGTTALAVTVAVASLIVSAIIAFLRRLRLSDSGRLLENGRAR
jgi:hypothetical protein